MTEAVEEVETTAFDENDNVYQRTLMGKKLNDSAASKQNRWFRSSDSRSKAKTPKHISECVCTCKCQIYA